MSEHYQKRPSEILGITDSYVAYCFDQACLYILMKIKDNIKPVFPSKDESPERGQFSSMYKQILKTQ